MALIDEAAVVPAVGAYFFHSTVNTPPPVDPDDPEADGYEHLGHTAFEEPFGITSEGGEQTVLPTWQNKSLRSITSPRVESVTFTLQQWTEDTYKLYYGANATMDPETGYVMTPTNPVETEGTLWVRISDGDEVLPFWLPRVSIFRADDISADAEAFMGLPVRATALGRSGQDGLYGLQPKSLPGS